MAYTGPSIVDYLNSTGQASDYNSRATLAQQKGIQNYTGTADQNTQLLGMLRTPAPTVQANSAIPSTSLNQSTQPLNVPPPPQNTPPAPVQSIDDLLKAYQTDTAGQAQAKQEQTNILGRVESLINKQGTMSARQGELQGQMVDPLQKQLNEINSQINGINASAFQATQASENRQAPTFAIYGEQAAIERQKSVQTYGLAAAASALTGQISLAQQNVQRAIDTEFGGIESQLKYQQTLLDLNRDNLSKEDQKKADAFKIKLDERARQIEEQKQTKNDVYKTMLEAASLGADNATLNAIQNSTSPIEAIKITANAGLYTQGQKINSQVVKLDNGNTVLLNMDTGEIIKNVGGAKAPSAGTVPGSIVDANGKPIKLTATQVDTISGFESTTQGAQEALTLLGKGVKTGPIEGTALQAKKITGQQNPDQLKLEQKLAKIKADFMKSISGAAVSESEAKRLSAFLPTIYDQESVIKSKLESLISESQRTKGIYLDTLGATQSVQTIVAPDGTEVIITD